MDRVKKELVWGSCNCVVSSEYYCSSQREVYEDEMIITMKMGEVLYGAKVVMNRSAM